jgi:pyruvate-formate lyase
MAYSYIPLTGAPIIGAFTTPIAGAIAIAISSIALDSVILLNREFLTQEYPEEFEAVKSDIDKLISVYGKDWDKAVQQTQKLLNSIKDKVDPNRNYEEAIGSQSLTLPESDSDRPSELEAVEV